MNDTPWNDAGATTSPEPAPARPPRQKRKPKAEAAPKVRKPRKATAGTERLAPGSSVDNPPKKPRKEKAERVAPDTIRISLKDYADMTCAPVAKEFMKVHKIVSGVSGIARARLLAEISKVFG